MTKGFRNCDLSHADMGFGEIKILDYFRIGILQFPSSITLFQDELSYLMS